MAHRFCVYGRVVVCDRPLDSSRVSALPDPASASKAADLHVWVDQPPDQPSFASYEVGGVARLSFHDGRHIHLQMLRPLDDAVVDHLVVDLAVPTGLTAWCAPVLHASGVAWGGSAVLFTGPSGAGKSTLALAAVRAGAGLLADDGVLCEPDRTVRGEPTSMRFHGDHATAMIGQTQGPVVTPTGKRRHDLAWVGVEVRPGPLPAAALVAIDDPGTAGGPARLWRCGAAEASAVVARSLFDPPSAADQAAGRLDRAAELAGWLPVWRLTYPRRLAALDDVVALVRARLDVG